MMIAGATAQSPISYEIMKRSPSGAGLIYDVVLPYQPVAMAVDPTGHIYLAGIDFVQKRGTDGSTVIYTTTISQNVQRGGLTVDASGRAYVTGSSNDTGLTVVARLNTSAASRLLLSHPWKQPGIHQQHRVRFRGIRCHLRLVSI